MTDPTLIIISLGLSFGLAILIAAIFFENKIIPTLLFSSMFIAFFVGFQMLDGYFLSISALLVGILLYVVFFGGKEND